MKKVLTALAVVLMIVGCATVKPAKKYPQLTGEHVKSTCKATDSWQIRVMPMPVIVIRFNEKGGCAGIKDLLLVITPTTDFTKEKRTLTARLTQLYYVDYLNREQPDADGKKWSARLIKRETSDGHSGADDIFYYKVGK